MSRFSALLLALSLSVGLSACDFANIPEPDADEREAASSAAMMRDDDEDEDEDENEDSSVAADDDEDDAPTYDEPAPLVPSPNEDADDEVVDGDEARIVEMSVDDWSFSPAMIQAKKGEQVLVRLKGVEGDHSFAIPDLGINVPVSSGDVKTVVIPTDEPGTYEFRCRIPCGDGHRDMKGTLVIQ